jgi:hypothetical protein
MMMMMMIMMTTTTMMMTMMIDDDHDHHHHDDGPTFSLPRPQVLHSHRSKTATAADKKMRREKQEPGNVYLTSPTLFRHGRLRILGSSSLSSSLSLSLSSSSSSS